METWQRLKVCSMKYEKMKNQRNKLANLTQSSSQVLGVVKSSRSCRGSRVYLLGGWSQLVCFHVHTPVRGKEAYRSTSFLSILSFLLFFRPSPK